MINFFFMYLFTGVLCLCLVRKHMLLCLISLEMIVIYLLMIIYYFCIFNNSMYLYVLVLTFFVCEGALGLSLMVFLVRFHSNDYVNSILLW